MNLGNIKKEVRKALAEHGTPDARFTVVRRFRKGFPAVCDIMVGIDDMDATYGVTESVNNAVQTFYQTHMNELTFTASPPYKEVARWNRSTKYFPKPPGKVCHYNAVWTYTGFLYREDFTR